MAFEKSLVGPDSTIRQVIKSINDSALQVALVVDKDRRLLGVVTDGDIRQGLLRNVGLDEPVVGIMNQSPTTAVWDRACRRHSNHAEKEVEAPPDRRRIEAGHGPAGLRPASTSRTAIQLDRSHGRGSRNPSTAVNE